MSFAGGIIRFVFWRKAATGTESCPFWKIRPEVYEGADAQSIPINGQDEGGQTALLLAAKHNRLEIVAGLLRDEIEQALPNRANDNDRTPFNVGGAKRQP